MEKEVIVKWNIKKTETSEILKLLPELAEKTRNEEGNVLYNIYQTEGNPDELILHERYSDEAAMEAHKNSEHYQNIVAGSIIPHLETREVFIVKRLF
jgi:quinol monooxygenase YgiN